MTLLQFMVQIVGGGVVVFAIVTLLPVIFDIIRDTDDEENNR